MMLCLVFSFALYKTFDNLTDRSRPTTSSSLLNLRLPFSYVLKVLRVYLSFLKQHLNISRKKNLMKSAPLIRLPNLPLFSKMLDTIELTLSFETTSSSISCFRALKRSSSDWLTHRFVYRLLKLALVCFIS